MRGRIAVVISQALVGLMILGWGLWQWSPALAGTVVGGLVFVFAAFDAWFMLRSRG